AATAAVPISPPTSRAPEIAVTSVFLTRFTSPTETVPPPVTALWIACSKLPLSVPRGAFVPALAGLAVFRFLLVAPVPRLLSIASPHGLGRFRSLSPRPPAPVSTPARRAALPRRPPPIASLTRTGPWSPVRGAAAERSSPRGGPRECRPP